MDKINNLIKKISVISHSRIGDIVFFISFAFIYIYRFYRTTMFTSLWGDPIWLVGPSYLALLVLAMLCVAEILDAILESWKLAAILAIILFFCFISMLTGGWRDPFVTCLLVVAARNRNIRPILVLSLGIGVFILMAAYFASINAYIPYLVYDPGQEMLLHAFGTVFRTDLAAHILYLVMIYAVFRVEKLMLWEYLMLWFSVLMVWRYTGARTDFVCSFVFLSILGIVLLWHRKKYRYFTVPIWTALIHLLCMIAVFAMIASWPVDKQTVLDDTSVGSLSSRIGLSREGIERYPINLFGHDVEERGFGGIIDKKKEYFYLDISYVRILIKGGVSILLIYIILSIIASARAANHHIILALALGIVAIESMIEQHAFVIAYNILILGSTGYFWNQQDRKEQIGLNNIK